MGFSIITIERDKGNMKTTARTNKQIKMEIKVKR